MRKQLDKNLSFHKLVAYMIALMTGEFLKKTLNDLSPNISSQNKAVYDTFFDTFQTLKISEI